MSDDTPRPAVETGSVIIPEAVRPSGQFGRVEQALLWVALDRPTLLIGLIAFLVLVMGVLKTDTFPTMGNAQVVLLDTAQTGILAVRDDGPPDQRHVRPVDRRHPRLLGDHRRAGRQGRRPAAASSHSCVGCGWGMLLGVLNGILVTRFKINALIATLGHARRSTAAPSSSSPAPGVTNIGNGYTVFGQTQILGIYSPFWFMAVIVLRVRLPCGPHALLPRRPTTSAATRGRRSCRASTSTARCSFFVIMGLLAGLAGALLASRLTRRWCWRDQGVELKVITAVVLGGASLSGGVGRISGAFLGVLLMALLQNAMIIAGINPFWQLIVVGIVLLVSVGLDQFARMRSRV